jgi:hypothetical protein
MIPNTEMAAAGPLIAFITLVVICGAFAAILGVPVDYLVSTHNGMIGAYPTSQDSVNTGENLVIAFRAMSFLLLLVLGLNYLNNSQREGSGDA